jgi:hypothetical protein
VPSPPAQRQGVHAVLGWSSADCFSSEGIEAGQLEDCLRAPEMLRSPDPPGLRQLCFEGPRLPRRASTARLRPRPSPCGAEARARPGRGISPAPARAGSGRRRSPRNWRRSNPEIEWPRMRRATARLGSPAAEYRRASRSRRRRLRGGRAARCRSANRARSGPPRDRPRRSRRCRTPLPCARRGP